MKNSIFNKTKKFKTEFPRQNLERYLKEGISASEFKENVDDFYLEQEYLADLKNEQDAIYKLLFYYWDNYLDIKCKYCNETQEKKQIKQRLYFCCKCRKQNDVLRGSSFESPKISARNWLKVLYWRTLYGDIVTEHYIAKRLRTSETKSRQIYETILSITEEK